MKRVAWLAFVLLAFAWLAPAVAADTVVYYHTDALRSVSVVTDAQGNVLERTRYAPYGQVLNRPLRDGPGYTGHQEDAATGLVYAQQRYYDPESGRFLSIDPIGMTASNGSNFNRYAYAGNNPYTNTDPDGRCPGSLLKDCSFVTSAVAITGNVGRQSAIAHAASPREKGVRFIIPIMNNAMLGEPAPTAPPTGTASNVDNATMRATYLDKVLGTRTRSKGVRNTARADLYCIAGLHRTS